jgi:hypothetical protein
MLFVADSCLRRLLPAGSFHPTSGHTVSPKPLRQAAETSRLTRWSRWISLRWSQQPFGRVLAAAALNFSPCASLSLMRRKARFALDRL